MLLTDVFICSEAQKVLDDSQAGGVIWKALVVDPDKALTLSPELWKYKFGQKHWEQESSMHMGKTVSDVTLSVRDC